MSVGRCARVRLSIFEIFYFSLLVLTDVDVVIFSLRICSNRLVGPPTACFTLHRVSATSFPGRRALSSRRSVLFISVSASIMSTAPTSYPTGYVRSFVPFVKNSSFLVQRRCTRCSPSSGSATICVSSFQRSRFSPWSVANLFRVFPKILLRYPTV